MIELNLKPLIKWLKKEKPKTVLVQLPEGLKTRAQEITESIEAGTSRVPKALCFGTRDRKRAGTSSKAVVLLDECFGACDLADEKAISLGVDALVHFGHTQTIKPRIKSFFVPLKQKIDLKEMKKKLLRELQKAGIKSVGLAATIQYIHFLKELKEFLEANGLRALAGKGNSLIKEKGQVLGCNYSSVKSIEGKVNAIVLLSDGVFHARGLALSSSKPVYLIDAGSGKVKEMGKARDRALRQRSGLIAKAKQSKVFGLLVSSKRGQQQLKEAFKAKKELEAKGKKGFVFAMDLVKEENLLGLRIEVWVNTACPRIGLDDTGLFKKPVIGLKELEVVLGKKSFKDYSKEPLL